MGGEIDYNVVVAELVSKYSDDVMSSLKSIIKTSTNAFRARLKKTYSNYLKKLNTNYSTSKTFVIPDEASELYDFYVPLSITTEKHKIDEPTLPSLCDYAPHSIIMGSAGCGKSMFMRHLLLSGIDNLNKIPVFIELRKLNEFEGDIYDYIQYSFSENGAPFEKEFIELSFKLGNYILLLDGLDELTTVKRNELFVEVSKITKAYPENYIIISC